jgi:hypothetical protein
MIGINYWQGTWPNRMNWIDPVFFIEANCPLLTNNCPTGDLVAKSDMKEYMVGRVNPNLIAYDPNFGFNSQDQTVEYRYQWLYAWEGSHIHWFLVNHATYVPNLSKPKHPVRDLQGLGHTAGLGLVSSSCDSVTMAHARAGKRRPAKSWSQLRC